jgi:hypothetical protein
MAKVTITKQQLEKAATLRAEGATWTQIREATGTKLGSTQFFKKWESDGIDHAPAGSKPRATASEQESEPAKQARTVRRGGKPASKAKSATSAAATA